MNSEFQFTEPKLKNIEFSINEDFDVKEENISIRLKTEVEILEGPEGSNSAFVVLMVTLGEKSADSPFYVYAEEKAAFKWESEKIYGIEPERLLKTNAPTLLLSYLRPIIATITSASVVGAYNIPFLNFKEGVDEKKKI